MIKSIEKMFERWAEYELLPTMAAGAMGYGQPMANIGAGAAGDCARKARRGKAGKLSARATATRNNGGAVAVAVPGDVERFGRLLASELLNVAERDFVRMVYVECCGQPRGYVFELAIERGFVGSVSSARDLLGRIHNELESHEARRLAVGVCRSWATPAEIMAALKAS